MTTVNQKKVAKAVADKVRKGKKVSISAEMKKAGYSESTSKTAKITKTKSWADLMDEYLPDKNLAKAHKELLGATMIEHMVFPTAVTDDEIKELLKSVNCTVRKIQHGDQANHCWFWARDNMALKNGLDLAYKLKGKYAPEKKEIDVRGLMDEEKADEIIKKYQNDTRGKN